jgi:hypothetical protein
VKIECPPLIHQIITISRYQEKARLFKSFFFSTRICLLQMYSNEPFIPTSWNFAKIPENGDDISKYHETS